MSAPTLTPRQEEFLEVAARSRTLAAAARELGVKEQTVARTLYRARSNDVLHRLTGSSQGVPVLPDPPAPPTPPEEEAPDYDAHRLAAIDPDLDTLDPDPNLIPIPFNGGDWREAALCAQTDPEAFFPDKGGTTRDAKRVCLACEVRVQCLDYALATDQRYGVWGGLSERERRRVQKRAV